MANVGADVHVLSRNIRQRIFGPDVCYFYQNNLFYALTAFVRFSDFLETLDDGTFFSPPTTIAPALVTSASFASTVSAASSSSAATITTPVHATVYPATTTAPAAVALPETAHLSTETILPAATKTEKFLLTAADQESGSRDERLNRVIRSKYEAGLLKPYNYVKGYARLSRWMDRK